MRRTLTVLLILFLLIFVARSAGAYRVDSKVTVEINPNAELLGVVYYLAFGKDAFVIDRGDYLGDVEKHFGDYRDEQAVRMLEEYIPKSMNTPERDYRLMVVEWYLLQCSPPPELTAEVPIGDGWMREFLPALRDFAEKTKFMDFYRAHSNYYDEDISIYGHALKTLPPDKFIGGYEKVGGITFEFLHPYLVAVHGHSFNPVIHGQRIWGAGGMLPLVRRTPQRTSWSYRTARDTMFGLPLNKDYVNNTGLDELIYLGFVYHELGHDITIPELDSNLEDVRAMDFLQGTIEENLPYLARYDIHFWNPGSMVYESFADGWSDFALSRVNENYTQLSMWMQRGWGEFWIDEVLELYEEYSNLTRATGKPISSYVPQMLTALQREYSPKRAEREFQERVPVTMLMAFDRGAVSGKVLVVYGTQNPDPSGTEKDRETAEEIVHILKKFYSQWDKPVNITVKADVELSQNDVEGNLVIIGGPVSNVVAKKMQKKFPLEFMKMGGTWVIEHNTRWNVSSFVLTENFQKPLLRKKLEKVSRGALLLTVRNPNNPQNFIVWIAGENRNLTALFRNPTYYLSSYEIWGEKGIEMGFYVQPLASS